MNFQKILVPIAGVAVVVLAYRGLAGPVWRLRSAA